MKVFEDVQLIFSVNEHLVLLHPSARNSFMTRDAEKDIEAFENFV